MTDTVKPFRAVYYNPKTFSDLSRLSCPPYDIISEKDLSVLRKRSEYNFSNILIATNNDYNRIGERFKEWFAKNILVLDEKECLYLYEQKFRIGAKSYKRIGILALLKMDKQGGIFPHEHTLSGPKEDRQKIIEKVEANLSPVFIIAAKKINYLHKIHQRYSRKRPFANFKDLDANVNIVWRVEQREEIERICTAIGNSNLVIADGHHRFEVAYGYYLTNKNRFNDLNYILAYLTDASTGLVILPTHRIVSLKDGADVLGGLKSYFKIEETSQDRLENKLKRDKNFSFGIFVKRKSYFLRISDEKILDEAFSGSVYRKLDTYILHEFVFPKLNIQPPILYTHNTAEAKKMATGGKVAFILRPVSLGAIFNIANKGYKLPQKSTYFYPKVYSGIVLRRFNPIS